MTSDFNPLVLIIESDEALARQMGLDLQAVGYGFQWHANPEDAPDVVQRSAPDLVLIDRHLTNGAGDAVSGFDLCHSLRRQGYRQIILMLMNHDTLDDRVQCLEAGADDYVLKPYHRDNLIRLTKLHLKPDTPLVDQLRFSNLILDLTSRQVLRRGRTIDLTMKEFELLKFLMEHPREVLTREQILENVWGYDFMGESNVIEVYIRYLRLKIEEDEGDKRLIQTVRGVGYVLREP